MPGRSDAPRRARCGRPTVPVMAESQTIIVTGATSRTGGVVARQLLSAGAQVRVLGRSRDRLEDLAQLGAETFVCEPTDAEQTREAFSGGRAAWVMLQPNYTPEHPAFRDFQDSITNAMVPAIAAAGVTHVVSLSGTEAELDAGTGPVLGLRYLEQQLDEVEGLNVLHLRAGYFMENLLSFAEQIAAGDVLSGPLSGSVALPLIATGDIGEAGAAALLALDFQGRVVRELHGERDLTLEEATAIAGRVLDRPNLHYVQTPLDEVRRGWRDHGMSDHVIDLMTQVAEGINTRGYHTSQPRSAATSTPTSWEAFVRASIAPLVPARPSAATP